MSGHTARTMGESGILPSGMNFIAKPFTYQALAQKVHEALS
jgi:hypothetical protein